MQKQQKHIRFNTIILFITAVLFMGFLGAGVWGLNRFRNSSQDLCATSSSEQTNDKIVMCQYKEELSSEIQERSIITLNFMFFTAGFSFLVAGFVYYNHNRSKK